ncbi:MAG: valine--tRNA ligase [Flavobacteriales bacterium]|nr:valine--tRNA ligase [Flavobacteriales bacterium]
MEIPSKYSPSEIEDKWYSYWIEKGFFHSTPDHRTPYTVVIPPPNVTGVLHMGHMMNNTIQDLLVRRARMRGFNACWVPGTDHASIATEAKVVARLKEQGIKKTDLTREEFLKHAWDWTHEHGGIILEQLKKLGASCDWQRTKFTMDDDMNQGVTDVFVDLYRKGLIYRGYRMVNWDPEALTTVSDEEVVYVEQQGKLYYLRYMVEGTSDYVIVATTRPETIFGDTAMCINPADERYSHLHGKRVIVPIVGRSIPVIEDDYVDIEFGTGCLKVTPAHDVNDKMLGEKHHLDVIDIFNDDASLNANGMHYAGMDRFVVRKKIEKELAEKGLLEKVENYTNKVGTSERTKAVIEPKVSLQWFLKMEDLATDALKAVMEDEIRFVPEKFKNTYRYWMENVHDWSISRQLWWGHRIPAYYYGTSINDFVVAHTKEEALTLAQEKTGNKNLSIDSITQDPDALDTWFSSWLWPMSVFDGVRHPDNDEIKYYYPTNDLVTAPDIIFFWVARMIMAGYHYRGVRPFKNVYFTGTVRDKLGRKMSKSLGNSPDPIKLMEQYGADSVRLGMLLTAPAGNDFPFDTDLCKQGANFCNKIWNAFRLVQGFSISDTESVSPAAQKAGDWFDQRLIEAVEEIDHLYDEFRLSEALMATYKLVWDDYCSWYLEAIKPPYGQSIARQTYSRAISHFEILLRLLHPIMPFITEELWHAIRERKDSEALVVSSWPSWDKKADEKTIKSFAYTAELIASIRGIRAEKGLSPKEQLSVMTHSKNAMVIDEIAEKLANISPVEKVNEKPSGAVSFMVQTDEYFIPLSGMIDSEAEIERLKKDLEYTQGFLASVRKKLSNERFVSSAPAQVVEIERKKEADALSKIATIEETIKSLS